MKLRHTHALIALLLLAMGAGTALALSTRTTQTAQTAASDALKKGQPTKVVNCTRINRPYDIDISCGLNVTYTPVDQTPVVIVTAPEALLPHVAVTQSSNNLTITLTKKGSRLRKRERIDVLITGRVPHAIDLNSGSKLRFDKGLQTDGDFSLEASSGAVAQWDVTLSVKGKFEIESSSGAVIKGKGIEARHLDIEANSGAVANLDAISTHSLKADANSGAVIHLSGSSTGKASLEANSGGVIRAQDYHAASTDVDVDTNSGGTIKLGKRP